MKQSFRFDYQGKIYGCSFRKRKNNSLYWGWITIYDNEKEYQHPTHWEDIKDINLTTDKETSKIALIDFCKKLEYCTKCGIRLDELGKHGLCRNCLGFAF